MISDYDWPGRVKMTETRRDNCSASVIILRVMLVPNSHFTWNIFRIAFMFSLGIVFWKITVAWNLGDCNLPWNYKKKTDRWTLSVPQTLSKRALITENHTFHPFHFDQPLIPIFFLQKKKLEYKTFEMCCFLYLTGGI